MDGVSEQPMEGMMQTRQKQAMEMVYDLATAGYAGKWNPRYATINAVERLQRASATVQRINVERSNGTSPEREVLLTRQEDRAHLNVRGLLSDFDTGGQVILTGQPLGFPFEIIGSCLPRITMDGTYGF